MYWNSEVRANIEGEIHMKEVELSLSFLRGVLFTCLIALPRSVILCWLGYVGVRFLVSTIELRELVLNAVALEVVLHADDMMF